MKQKCQQSQPQICLLRPLPASLCYQLKYLSRLMLESLDRQSDIHYEMWFTFSIFFSSFYYQSLAQNLGYKQADTHKQKHPVLSCFRLEVVTKQITNMASDISDPHKLEQQQHRVCVGGVNFDDIAGVDQYPSFAQLILSISMS